jgi:hypothetical protein
MKYISGPILYAYWANGFTSNTPDWQFCTHHTKLSYSDAGTYHNPHAFVNGTDINSSGKEPIVFKIALLGTAVGRITEPKDWYTLIG